MPQHHLSRASAITAGLTRSCQSEWNERPALINPYLSAKLQVINYIMIIIMEPEMIITEIQGLYLVINISKLCLRWCYALLAYSLLKEMSLSQTPFSWLFLSQLRLDSSQWNWSEIPLHIAVYKMCSSSYSNMWEAAVRRFRFLCGLCFIGFGTLESRSELWLCCLQ